MGKVRNSFKNTDRIEKLGNGGGGGGGSASFDIVAEETKIGTYLGEDLYRQVFSVSLSTSTLYTSVQTSGLNIKNVVSVKAVHKSGWYDTSSSSGAERHFNTINVAASCVVFSTSLAMKLANIKTSASETLSGIAGNVDFIVEYTKN